MAESTATEVVKTWRKRIDAAKTSKSNWETENRVEDCYQYWRGKQRKKELDQNGHRRVVVNKIHAEIKNNLPSLYFYRPFARLTAQPELANDPGTGIEDQTQLLQDTVNHLIRDTETRYRENTYLALKEAQWAMGVVEVGYSADFIDARNKQEGPELKEKKDTKGTIKPKGEDLELEEYAPQPLTPATPDAAMMAPNGLPSAVPQIDPMQGLDPETVALQEELTQLQAEIRKEYFFVKYIPCRQILVSISDRPILEDNDWVGYWEDLSVEDVKASQAYKIKGELKANTGEGDKKEQKESDKTGAAQRVRLYKIWDLRTKIKYVFAEGHDTELMAKSFKRCPLKFLRFDVDPYCFYPRPPILSKLGPQDEYNDSREYLRQVRNGTVPRYTYDENAITAENMRKLEGNDIGQYIPRGGGSTNVIEPVQQPSYSENAIQTLTLSDKEFMDVGGLGGDARIAQTKTATQAKIAEAKTQAQDSFERSQVADFLAEVADELLRLAIDHMSKEKWVIMNVAADSLYNQQLSMDVADKFTKVNSQILTDTTSGICWAVVVDIESLSPVSEEEKLAKWMQGLELIANPAISKLFAVAPPLLEQTLKYLGIKSAKEQGMIAEGLQKLVMMEAEAAAMGQASSKGIPSKPADAGGGQPGKGPGPNPPQPNPQPGGPVGPGAIQR